MAPLKKGAKLAPSVKGAIWHLFGTFLGTILEWHFSAFNVVF